jgi:hypothetical protein
MLVRGTRQGSEVLTRMVADFRRWEGKHETFELGS